MTLFNKTTGKVEISDSLSKKKAIGCPSKPSSRQVVEAAIAISKDDKWISWEQASYRLPPGTEQWNANEVQNR